MQRRLVPTLIIAAVALAACASAGPATWTFAPGGPDASSAAGPAASGGAAAPAGAVLGTLEVEAFDSGFTPSQLTVDAPGRYAVTLTNTGQIPHDITFPGGEQAVAIAAEAATVEVDVPASGLSFLCSVPGHEQAGMVGTLAVTGADRPTRAASSS